MTTTKIGVLLRIERARRKLYKIQKENVSLTHPKVIQQSRLLDVLINKYQGS
ncbi:MULTISPECIES: aspartyl-phosphate phosphatase Spo0E family protein [Paenibacillus]|uniref:aspartyl-phosphate phosphatase Spo0E family protein n=1 Tax=Paenibacillus TaxID=44249 RepID=UPI0009FDA60A|nr:aspartyl-phosphate phosphatase Spo0E family protein [Paenibacillus massiliensis]